MKRLWISTTLLKDDFTIENAQRLYDQRKSFNYFEDNIKGKASNIFDSKDNTFIQQAKGYWLDQSNVYDNDYRQLTIEELESSIKEKRKQLDNDL